MNRHFDRYANGHRLVHGLQAVLTWSLLAGIAARAGEVTFVFNYEASFTTNAGGNLAAAQSDFSTIGTYLSSVIKTNGAFNKTVSVTVSGSNDPLSGTLASAGPLTFIGAAFNKGVPQAMIQDDYVFASNAASATVNFGASWGFQNTVASNEYDFQYVLLHEMFHALGFSSYIDSNGTSEFAAPPNNAPLAYSYFDRYIQGWDGAAYTDFVTRAGNTPTGFMAGGVAALTNSANPLRFVGPNVQALLGGPAQLYTPANWEPGSSVSHYNYPGLLEYYSVTPGNKNAVFGDLDVAFLADIGYTNVVPEPGAFMLTAIALAVGGYAVRRQRRAGQRRVGQA